MKFFSFWSWLFVLSLRYPDGHPWKDKRFTLADWYRGASPLTHAFDAGFWLGSVAVALLPKAIFL